MLKLNNGKTEFFLLSYLITTSSICHQFLSWNWCHSPFSVQSYGVIFDTHMTMTSRGSFFCSGLNLQLRSITRIRRYLDFNTCNHHTSWPAFYGNALLLGISHNDATRLQRLQNSFYRATKHDHVHYPPPFLQQLHCMAASQSEDNVQDLAVCIQIHPWYFTSVFCLLLWLCMLQHEKDCVQQLTQLVYRSTSVKE